MDQKDTKPRFKRRHFFKSLCIAGMIGTAFASEKNASAQAAASTRQVPQKANDAWQDNWRWCNKCQGLFFQGLSMGICPAGGEHDSSGSVDYSLLYI